MIPRVLDPAVQPASAALQAREQVLDQMRRHVNSGQARLFSLMGVPVEASSEGAWVQDTAGRHYLDAGGYGVFLMGHGHPRVVTAVTEQLRRHALSTRLFVNAPQAHAAAALASCCPPGLQYVFFGNSGTEATEAGLKLAHLNGCTRVIAATGGYHGKTLGALGVTANPLYRSPFETRLGPTRFVPFGDADAMEVALAERAGGKTAGRACVIVEPVQAEAGVMLPPPGYLRALRAACDRHGALLVFDEIQCGLGRTGRWWACDREDVAPDILLVGKGLSGGCVPVGAMVATAEVQEPFNRNPLLHSSTFGGNPLAMAAVIATLAILHDERLVEHSNRLGLILLQGLQSTLASGPPAWQRRVRVRGAGLLLGLEFTEPSNAAAFVMALLERQVIACHSLNDHRVVRLTPPAILTDAEAALLIAAAGAALATTLNSSPEKP